MIGVRATRADVVWRVAERVVVDKQVKGSDVDDDIVAEARNRLERLGKGTI